MKLTFNHLSFENLADLAEGRLAPDARDAATAHVSGCPRCAAKLTELERVVGLMRADKAVDAPPALVAQAVNLFRTRAARTEPSLVRRVVAALSFDSLQMTPAYGVRSGQAVSRQILYNAGQIDLDLRITPSGDSCNITGQMLGSNCAGGKVELKGASVQFGAELNDQCEFRLPPVPAGTYNLRLLLTDTEVEVPNLEIRA
ncbi:MAG TPA: hypothetical protein VF791_12265 [Pyrinomonadaceae bacterium]